RTNRRPARRRLPRRAPRADRGNVVPAGQGREAAVGGGALHRGRASIGPARQRPHVDGVSARDHGGASAGRVDAAAVRPGKGGVGSGREPSHPRCPWSTEGGETMTTTAEARAAQVDDPGFGRYFTDHMAMARWDRSRGWHHVEVVPRQDLVMHPSAMVLHYGQAVFEGLKACVQGDGGVALFRPSANAARFSRSAARLAMPELPIALFLATCEDLVRADREWVPARPEHSLYLRPVMIASEPSLGVRPANEFLYFVIASPTAGFFPGGVRPISVWVADDYVRAAPHGLGSAKCPSNYAASLLGKKEAVARGCDEVVWLDAVERRWVEEMSGMNVFVVLGEAGGRRAARARQRRTARRAGVDPRGPRPRPLRLAEPRPKRRGGYGGRSRRGRPHGARSCSARRPLRGGPPFGGVWGRSRRGRPR